MVKELSCTINGGFLQSRRKGDDTNIISQWEEFGVFDNGYGTRLIQKYERFRCVRAQSLRYLKSKYFLFFSAHTQWVFSLPREGR